MIVTIKHWQMQNLSSYTEDYTLKQRKTHLIINIFFWSFVTKKNYSSVEDFFDGQSLCFSWLWSSSRWLWISAMTMGLISARASSVKTSSERLDCLRRNLSAILGSSSLVILSMRASSSTGPSLIDFVTNFSTTDLTAGFNSSTADTFVSGSSSSSNGRLCEKKS